MNLRDPNTGRRYRIENGLVQPIESTSPVSEPRVPAAAPLTPVETGGVGVGDYVKSVLMGGASIVESAGWLTRQLGAQDVGSAIEELGSEAVDYWNDSLSDSARNALSREFIHKNEHGEYEWGDASLHTVGLMGAQSLLGTAAGMGAGAAVTRGLQVGAGAAMAQAGGQAARGAGITSVLQTFANPYGRTALQQAARQGSEAAVKKLRLIDTVLGATGFGVGEGLVGGMMGGLNVEQSVRQIPLDRLMQNDRYRQVYESTDDSMGEMERHKWAMDTVAQEASSEAGLKSGLVTGLLGAPMGAFFARVLGQTGRLGSSRLRAGGFGAAGEAGQEFLQSGAEAGIAATTREELGEQNVQVFQEMLNEAIGGAAAGGLLGGAVGAGSFQADVPRGTSGETDSRTTMLRNMTSAAERAARAGADPQQAADIVRAVVAGEVKPLDARRQIRDLERAAYERATEGLEVVDQTQTVDIEPEAQAAAGSAFSEVPEPTRAQATAGNYQKGHIKGEDIGLPGMQISIESSAGSQRRGVDRRGEAWEQTMRAHYGDIKGTVGGDAEELDIYVRPDPNPEAPIYLIHQVNKTNKLFNEHKIMTGFDSREEALAAYDVPPKYEISDVVEMTREELMDWTQTADTSLPHPRAKMPEPATPVRQGSVQRAFTPTGRQIEARYELREADSLLASHTQGGQPNPGFPGGLQPRDRTRAGMTEWVRSTANPERFRPELVVEGGNVAEGAPVIGPDGVVESGNGRTLVFQLMYNQGDRYGESLKAYNQYLRENLDRFGLSEKDLEGLDKPVLVRERLTPLSDEERIAFTREANQPAVAALSPSEQARVDSERVTPEMLETFEPSPDGNVLAPSNDRFVQAFIQQLPESERASLMTADGRPTRQLADRIKAATFRAAYEDERLLGLMAEDAEPETRNVVNALTAAAPAFARARAAGALDQVNVIEPLIEAVNMISESRRRGQSIDEMIGQQDAFAAANPDRDRLARFLDQNIRSSRRMGQALTELASTIEQEAVRRRSGALFGEQPLDLTTALQGANARLEAADTPQPSMFEVAEGEVATFTGISETAPRPPWWKTSASRRAGSQIDLFAAPRVKPQASRQARQSEVESVQVGTMRSDFERVTEPEEAAHIMMPLRKQAQENLMALVTDADGRPLAAMRHSIGTVSSASAEIGLMVGQIHNLPGAKNVWLVHNHPTGNPTQSDADIGFTQRVMRGTEGTGIEVHGMIVVAPNTRNATFYSLGLAPADIPVPNVPAESTDGTEVPVMGDRQFTRSAEYGRRQITNRTPVEEANKVITEMAGSKAETGVLLQDFHGNPLAWVPMNTAEMQALRTGEVGTGASRILQEAERTNATSMTIRHRYSDDGTRALMNVGSFANSMGMPVWRTIGIGKRSAILDTSTRNPSGSMAFHSRPPAPQNEPSSDLPSTLQTDEQKANYLHDVLAVENQSWVNPILEMIDAELGTKSDSDRKKVKTILEKTQRPVVRAEKPWFGVEHVRDTFRWKTGMNTIADAAQAIEIFMREAEASGNPVVTLKVDTRKLENPKAFGWRFFAVDLKLANGQMAEWYLSPKELIAYNGARGHVLFEKWRDLDPADLSPEQRAEFAQDERESSQGYLDALNQVFERTGEDFSSVRAAATNFAAAASSSLSQSAMSPNVTENSGTNQAPPGALNALNPSDESTAYTEPPSDLATNIEDSITSPPDESVTQTPQSGLSNRRVDHAIQRLMPVTESLSPLLRFNVVDTVADLPDPNAPADVEGAYFQDGSVYLVRENLTPERVPEVFAHEVLGHMATERDPQLGKIIGNVNRAANRNPQIRALRDEVRARQGYLPAGIEGREILALMSERGVNSPILSRFRAAVRAKVTDFGVQDMTQEDLARYLRVAAKDLKHSAAIIRDFNAAAGVHPEVAALRSNSTDDQILAALDRLGETRDGPMYQRAFHGTPHNLSESEDPTEHRFSTQYIGTGEGAQAYGWGLYFTSKREIAEWYRDNLSIVHRNRAVAKEFKRQNPELYDEFAQAARNFAVDRRMSPPREDFIGDLLDATATGVAPDFVSDDLKQRVSTVYDRAFAQRSGRLYEAEIPEDTELMDWEKPLSEQTWLHDKLVQNKRLWRGRTYLGSMLWESETNARHAAENRMKLERYNIEPFAGRYVVTAPVIDPIAKGSGIANMPNDPNGEDLYLWLSNETSPQRASQILNESGIKGHSYVGRTSDERNFVIYDDAAIQTAAMYSRPAPASPEIQGMMDRLMAPAPENMTAKDRVRDKIREVANLNADSIIQGTVDSLRSIENLEREIFGDVLDAADSPSKAARATRNLPSVMSAVLMKGVPVYNQDFELGSGAGGWFDVAEDGRKGFMEIFQPAAEHPDGNMLQQTVLYMAAKRANLLTQEGREKLFTQEEIDAALALGEQHPFMEEIAQDWETFNHQLLDLAVDRGVLPREMVETWKQNFYVPFFRVVDEIRQGPSRKGGLEGHGAQSSRRRLTGSDKPLGDVFENMLGNVTYLIDEVYKNTAMQKIADMADGVAMEQVPAAWRPIGMSAGEAERAMRNAGIEVEKLSAMEKKKMVRFFERVAPPGRDVVSVYENGKPVYYRVHDDLLLRSISSFGYQEFTDVFGLLRGSKRLLTDFITADPAFQMANWMRDTLSTWVVANTKGLKPLTDAAKGFKQALTQDPDVVRIMMAGGGGGMYYDSEPADVRKWLSQKMSRNKAEGFMKTIVSPKNLLRAWRNVGQAAENANRVAIYKRVIAAGGTPAEAAYQARDVLNFSRSGDFKAMQFLIGTVPFMNARIQGLSRLYRGYKDNPAGFMLKGGMITAATMALLLRNQDREEYEELNEWDKDMYWHIFLNERGTPVEAGQHWRIPKPFEVGTIFATMFERTARGLTGADDAATVADAAHRAIAGTLAMRPIPQLFVPMIEQYANRSLFFDSPIIGLAEQGKTPEAQYNPWTSETARLTAEAMPDFAPAWMRSPKRLEAAVRGYLGATGMYMMEAADILVRGAGGYPEAPSRELHDMPVVKRFMRDPNPTYTKYSDQLYDMLEESNALFRTINEYQRQQRSEDARELLAENRSKLATRRALNQINTQVRNINNQIRTTMYSPELTGDQKQERIERLDERKNQVLRRVGTIADMW